MNPVDGHDIRDGLRGVALLRDLVRAPLEGQALPLIGPAEAELLLEALDRGVLPVLAVAYLHDHGELLVTPTDPAVRLGLCGDPELAQTVIIAPHQKLHSDNLDEPLQAVASHGEIGFLIEHDLVVKLLKRLRIASTKLCSVHVVSLEVPHKFWEGHLLHVASWLARLVAHRAHETGSHPGLLCRGHKALLHELRQRSAEGLLSGIRLRPSTGPTVQKVGAALAGQQHGRGPEQPQPAPDRAGEVHRAVLVGGEHQVPAHHGGLAGVGPAAVAGQQERLEPAGVHAHAEGNGRQLRPRPPAQELPEPQRHVLRAHAVRRAGPGLHQARRGAGLEDLRPSKPRALRHFRVDGQQLRRLARLRRTVDHPEQAARGVRGALAARRPRRSRRVVHLLDLQAHVHALGGHFNRHSRFLLGLVLAPRAEQQRRHFG
mmetsp:Transcript_53919/g.150632  ORF Transcript_53919/g.150632 Transcript_53919/m.150632 type:complete len:430 (+) Transcript_53919:2811-4100(+)